MWFVPCVVRRSIFVLSFCQEWHLIFSHYIVVSAFKGSCQDIKEELFYQYNGKYLTSHCTQLLTLELSIIRKCHRLRCYE